MTQRTHSLIVGGTRGIGRVVVRVLSGEGHVLSVIGRRPPADQERSIRKADYWTVDLTERERLFASLAEILGKNGKLSCLVFCQRYRGKGDSWMGEMETSLTATKNIIERLADEFDGGSQRCIVIVSSIAGHFITEEQPLSYHVAKAGMDQMARYFAYALGPKGIRVNCVSSGTVLKEESKEVFVQNKHLYELNKGIIPLRCMVTAEDIAHVVAFLCSSRASLITGQNIIVDGGLSLQWQESLARMVAGQRHPIKLDPS